MKYTQTTPCNQCPFLKKFSHGYSMQRLIQLALIPDFPCHKTCVVDDDDEKQEFTATENSIACAGAMIFLAKRKDKFYYGFDDSKLNMKAKVR